MLEMKQKESALPYTYVNRQTGSIIVSGVRTPKNPDWIPVDRSILGPPTTQRVTGSR